MERNALEKSAFYATMSHAIRAPLGGLIGVLTALEGTRLDEAPCRHAGLRALVVDDDRINRRATGLVLRRLGVWSVEAETHAAVRERTAAEPFDVALLDQHMPGGLGTELATELLARPAPPLVVILTASALAEDRAAILAAGVSELEALGRTPEAVELRRIARRVEGGSANVGARALVEAAKQVEDELPKTAAPTEAAAHAHPLTEACRRALRAIAILLDGGGIARDLGRLGLVGWVPPG